MPKNSLNHQRGMTIRLSFTLPYLVFENGDLGSAEALRDRDFSHRKIYLFVSTKVRGSLYRLLRVDLRRLLDVYILRNF
ncbi:hypothetical protein H1P_190015 [Hyella patelloides LEGE 07179]|uniref:Uncharacterized protein n=1 Tax=Hyella patelloides LEGE 07179 TaxID=945734 RepID=A0A563VP36_9CYAN|nr:hypothetical protein [Hyella patelloides]VEP13216.1 hypothetical protein H1P_190015 [Hyella patelloides LEGE 07179]